MQICIGVLARAPASFRATPHADSAFPKLPGRLDCPGQASQTGQAGQAAQTGPQAAQLGFPGGPDSPSRPASPGLPAKPDRLGQASQAGQAAQTGSQAAQMGLPGSPRSTTGRRFRRNGGRNCDEMVTKRADMSSFVTVSLHFRSALLCACLCTGSR